MRVTNSMVYGGAMNNIWRNARHLNKLITQIETGKQIQRPSDDPFISSRSLRYRTILSESEQFSRNANQGMAWMEASEAAFNSILTGSPTQPSAMQRINDRLVEATQTGTNTLDDQRAILTELKQYYNQMFRVDMNQTYLGRYVFSGFHTDQPPALKTDWPERSFVIQQSFLFEDIEKTLAFHRPNITDMPIDYKINVIKLPYNNVSFDPAVVAGVAPAVPPSTPIPAPVPGITLADGTVVNIITTNSSQYDATIPFIAYDPPDDNGGTPPVPVIHYISDTGELVMSNAVRSLVEEAGGINITYEKNNITAGELNPIVYFQTTEITTGVAEHFNTQGNDIQIEISPGAYVTINSHAQDILTSNLFADLKRLFDFTDSLVPSDPRVIEEYFRGPPQFLTEDALHNAVQEFLSDEQAMFAGAVYDRMNNMLEFIMNHADQAQREHTALGSRMARLEMIQIRLEEDEVAYTALLSENEDTSLADTIMRKSGAEAAFNHALMAIAKTTQLSLADYINR